MKRLFGLLLVVLAVLAFSFGCNGANEVTGPNGDGRRVAPAPTPRPTPKERPPRCGAPKSDPLDCERAGERSAS
jgi:hypothetical protein